MHTIANYERGTDRSGRPVVLVPLDALAEMMDRLEYLEDILESESPRARILAGEEKVEL